MASPDNPVVRRNIVLLAALVGTLSISSVYADQQLYRCTVKGSTVYQDKPCDSHGLSGISSKPSAIDVDYTTPYGEWRGQAQYQSTVKGQLVPEAHSVVPLVIKVEEQGKVTGISPANGCKILGVATPSLAPTLLTLDVTLSGCHYSDFNRRYRGTLGLYKTSNTVQLSLLPLQHIVLAVGVVKGFDIRATMRR